MAKSKKKSEDKYTAEDFYELGRDYYKLAVEFEDNNESQEKIDNSWGIAATNFWLALTIGSEKAPLALSKCFGQGVGVKKDENIEKLLYGAALKLTPQDCAKIPAEEKPVIPKSMNPRIEALVKLVKDAHSKIPTKGVDMEVVDNQMTKFNNAIKLPSGKLIQSCFTEKSTAAITSYDEAGASSSQHNASYETCPDTSFESEEDVGLAGSSHPHM